MTKLRDEFTEAMENRCTRIEAETELRPTKTRGMIIQHGGQETANTLLGPAGENSYGYEELKGIGRLDLTVECLALRSDFQPLFSKAQLAAARQRLSNDGFDPEHCEHE